MSNQMARRGLRIDDDDQKPKYEKQSLDANRKRSNFEKDMDDLLFGGGMKPVRRQQPKEETNAPKTQAVKPPVSPPKQTEPVKVPQPVKPTTQPSKGVDVVKQPQSPRVQQQTKVAPVSPRTPRSDSRPKVQPKSPERPARIQQPRNPTKPSQTTNQSIKSIGLISKVQPEKQPQEPVSIIVEEKSQIQQPKHHEEPKIGVQQSVEVSRLIFNKPSYFRKFKKVAEEFNFVNENSNNHSAVDIVRPFECDRNRVKKQSEPDFYDYEFPPTSYSLGYSLKSTSTEWKRHNELVKSSILGKYIDPNDISPGKLSSQQFLSTLSVLAENEANIKRLIEDQKANAHGFYYVRLNINGVWRYVSVDNKLPFANGEALGAQSFPDHESELWPALIEKAYAKVYSGYDVFNRTTPRENFLRDLTGAPVRKYLVTDNDLPNVIRNAITAGQPVLAVPKQQIISLGLNPNNSFTVLSCKSNGGLELRNSWGTLDQKIKLPINKEGVFELSSNQSKEFISHVIIAFTNNSYSSSTIESKHKNGFYSTFIFSVRNDTHGYLTVSQWDDKLFPQKSYEYSPIRLIVQRKNEDGSVSYVNGGFSSRRNLDVEVNLIPGEYEVFVAGHWKGRQYDYDLTFFGKEMVSFRRQYVGQFPNKIAQSLTRLNLETGKRSALGNCDQYIQHHKETNLVLVTADNTSDKDYLFNQDFSKINWETLLLLTAKNNEQNYANLSGTQTEDLKHNANSNRKWSVSIKPKGKFTWIISTSEDFDAQNFKKWGFR